MTFEHLEDRLDENELDSYIDLFGSLREPTKTVLGYTLDIGAYLDSINLRKRYALFGGYAVLSHLMEQFGESVATSWRGSTDIDMVGDQRVLQTLKSGYAVISDLPSPNIANKRTVKLTENEEEECKIDFYVGNLQELVVPQTNVHFGIPLTIADPLSLIKGKLKTPEYESVHSQDVLAMLTVLEKKGYSPQEITGRFQDRNERSALDDMIKKGMQTHQETRIGFIPSKPFVKSIHRDLRRSRSVA